MAKAEIAGHTNMSEEDNSRMCDPCKFGGVNTQAVTFCLVCSEYLCDTCEEVHRRLRATRDHELKPFDMPKRRSIKQKALISSVMRCTVHAEENLSLICLSHDVPICDRCSTIKHRRCEVQSMKEAVHEAKTNNKVKVFLENIRSLSTAIIELKDSREKDKIQITTCCMKSRQDTIELKREVIKWIEKLAEDVEDAIYDIEKERKTEVENDIKATEEMRGQLKETIDCFECLGNTDQEAAFVLMKKEKHKLDEGIDAKDDILKEVKPIKLEFQKSDKLVKFMSEINSMGTLKTEKKSSGDTEICFPQISSLTRRDITTGSTIGVTGCVFMPDGRLVVCEGNGSHAVKVFSEDFNIQSEMKIDYSWNVAALSENQVIVSQREGKCLQFLNISENIAKGEIIPVGMKCWGVDYKTDKLFVTCHDETGNGGMVKILTMTGDTVNTFNVSQGHPNYLAVNSAGDRIVVSTDTHDSVQCYDSTGTTLFTYSDSQLSVSLGVLFDLYDNFMVCGRRSKNLHVVSSDGTKQNMIFTAKDGIKTPHCLAYRPSDKTLVIGQIMTSLFVFKIN